MSAKPKMQERLSKSARPQTRRAERRPASAPVLVQSSHGDRTKARLRDISVYGCNVISEAEWLRLGIFVAIRLEGGQAIQAIVRWVRDGACGVEFLRPIAEGDAQALADRWN